MDKRSIRRGFRKVVHYLGVVVGASALTLAVFLVLPVLQAIQGTVINGAVASVFAAVYDVLTSIEAIFDAGPG